MKAYLSPAKDGNSEYIEKKSRFVGQLFRVSSEEDVKLCMELVKKEHYDARHHCWCYILLDGTKRYSDDGEPQGTAGQPMLNVFERENVQNVLCVVTRYFGGILLGTGGLSRAYAKTARDALLDAGIAENRVWTQLEVPCPYGLFERVKLQLTALGGILENADYGADITLQVLLPEEQTASFADYLQELSAGKVAAREIGKTFRAVLLEK